MKPKRTTRGIAADESAAHSEMEPDVLVGLVAKRKVIKPDGMLGFHLHRRLNGDGLTRFRSSCRCAEFSSTGEA